MKRRASWPERTGPDQIGPLVLGPLLRHVDETSAVLWVEVEAPATVAVRAGGRLWATPTFAVHGHHYALVDVDGLSPGDSVQYEVLVDGESVWPDPASPYPPSRLRTLDPGREPRVLYGSCRASVSHDRQGNKAYGVDSLRAYGLRLATEPETRWPDLLLFIGDQVYADETSGAIREFIASRRDIDEPPGPELADYQEYAHLYALAWTDPANRWLLSTLPSAMIFDDHDVRDDWNTSETWRAQMAEAPWWEGRITAALMSYWVYQHLGNLSPADRAEDEPWQQVRALGPDADAGPILDAFAQRANTASDSYRWSFARRLGETRLVVIDTRAARVLIDDKRSIVDDVELGWLDDQIQGDCDHLLIASSLPFLMPVGAHHLEAWNEAVCAGNWGARWSRWGEKFRQAADLEHWSAFGKSFRQVANMALEVAEGKRGSAPATVVFLGGDVHHSYLSEVDLSDRPTTTRMVQAVCSPIRNQLPRVALLVLRFASSPRSWGFIRLARAAKVPDPPFRWDVLEGPWIDNNLATVAVHGRALRLLWERGVIRGRAQDQPDVEVVRDVRIG